MFIYVSFGQFEYYKLFIHYSWLADRLSYFKDNNYSLGMFFILLPEKFIIYIFGNSHFYRFYTSINRLFIINIYFRHGNFNMGNGS